MNPKPNHAQGKGKKDIEPTPTPELTPKLTDTYRDQW